MHFSKWESSSLLKRNYKKFSANNFVIVNGTAPQSIHIVFNKCFECNINMEILHRSTSGVTKEIFTFWMGLIGRGAKCQQNCQL